MKKKYYFHPSSYSLSEIEEFYDGSASAELGAKASTEKVSLGLNGEGRKITKRVIKFKGFNNQVEHILQEIDITLHIVYVL